jgi:hypothetical protein
MRECCLYTLCGTIRAANDQMTCKNLLSFAMELLYSFPVESLYSFRMENLYSFAVEFLYPFPVESQALTRTLKTICYPFTGNSVLFCCGELVLLSVE